MRRLIGAIALEVHTSGGAAADAWLSDRGSAMRRGLEALFSWTLAEAAVGGVKFHCPTGSVLPAGQEDLFGVSRDLST